MKSSLTSRLEDIPGVASVTVDLDGFGRGIDVRLEPDADEIAVMEKLRALLAAYGVRQGRQPRLNTGRQRTRPPVLSGVDISIAPVQGGARIEVATRSVKSFRMVAAEPLAVAQGLADAWCQVIGRVPVEIESVDISDDDILVVSGHDGEHRTEGEGNVGEGWVDALTMAIAQILGEVSLPDLRRAAS